MIIDMKNTKIRNAFIVLGVIGFGLMFLPPLLDSMKYQRCLNRVGDLNKELCEIPQYLNEGSHESNVYAKLAGAASMILGCLFLMASGGYLVTKLLKKEVSKMRSDIAREVTIKEAHDSNESN